jgi:hypothetical protein
MEIWNKRNILEIICEDTDTNEQLRLYYGILATTVADRWSAMIDKNNKANNHLRFNYRKILSFKEVEKQFQEFKQNIEYINANYDIKLTEIISVNNLRIHVEVLNDLHEQFEVYGDRLEDFIQSGYFDDPKASPRYNPVWPGDVHNKVLHESFLKLNEQIHNFEAIFRTWNNNEKSICTCLVDFMPTKPPENIVPEDYLHEQLKPEDFILFTPEHQWGWLYLGYNTLGKHWSSACHDNDIEVVRRKQIRPQQRFAAEMYMNFRPSSSYYSRIALHQWWTENNFSEFINPELTLRELALGFIPVGQLQGYAVNYEPTIDAKTITDIDNWNLKVWSKFNSIKSVKVIKK